MSNVLLESMAAGVPVVATRVGGAAEAVEDGVTGLLVEPKAPEALAQGIHRLLTDGELARSCGRAGQRRMTERYGFDAAIQKTERLYRSLLEERGHAV
jgi:glycosyltransferase involved in cell wall biosynthesis